MVEILVLDDDLDLRESLAEVLTGAGFAVTLASRGEEALELVQQRKFDLILLDLVMPGMNGLEVMGRIREKLPHVPVIMITAFASIENAVEAMRKGATDYITKPFRVDALLATVRRSLEEARFEAGRAELDLDSVMSCLANPIRREILSCIGRGGGLRFMDICRQLEMEDHTKMNFHLKTLKEAGLLIQNERKLYLLSEQGLKVMEGASFLLKKIST